MINERFSYERFEALGPGSREADRLAAELQGVIAEEVLPDLRVLGEIVAGALRRLGHQVHESGCAVDDSGTAYVGFVDARGGGARRHQRLRFDLDLTVSAGFPGQERPGRSVRLP